jgi:hypothetical protein
MRNDRYLVGTRIINRLNLSGTFEERLDFSRYSAQSFPSDPSDHFIAGGRRYAMKGRNKSPSSAKGRVLSKAFGPAAEEFGEELRPVGREVGAVAVRATRALLKPVGGLVWGFEKVEEWIAESIAPKVAGIPPQHRVEPKLVVAGPALEAMKYCGSEPHLRELFANLLATSMDGRRAASAHPAFVEMVKQLSPGEARILRYMVARYRESEPIIHLYRAFERLERDENGEPVLGFHKVFGPYSLLSYYAGCQDPQNTPTYISNLSRLEIIRIEFPAEIDATNLEDLLSSEVATKWQREIQADRKSRDQFRYETGWISLTPLGQQFLDVCVRTRQQME